MRECYVGHGISIDLKAEKPPCSFPELNPNLVALDLEMTKKDLFTQFNGIDVEELTMVKLKELGLVFQENLTFLNNPLIHKYKDGNSPARYFIETVVGKDAVLASFLPPETKTSKHPHSSAFGIIEGYYPILGESDLQLGNMSLKLKPGVSVDIPFDTQHQMFTGNQPAFTLIVMKNAGLVARDNWHR
jgi:hypothetical protein